MLNSQILQNVERKIYRVSIPRVGGAAGTQRKPNRNRTGMSWDWDITELTCPHYLWGQGRAGRKERRRRSNESPYPYSVVVINILQYKLWMLNCWTTITHILVVAASWFHGCFLQGMHSGGRVSRGSKRDKGDLEDRFLRRQTFAGCKLVVDVELQIGFTPLLLLGFLWSWPNLETRRFKLWRG